MKSTPFYAALFMVCVSACTKEPAAPANNTSAASLVLKFSFDSTQVRLNNLGQPAVMAAGHAGQSPRFNTMSAHYAELAPAALTPLGKGAILYRAPETTAGGSNAIDFEKASFAGAGETFLKIPIRDIAAGSYEWLRLSLAYQNFDVNFYVDTVINGMAIKRLVPGTAAGFIGYNTYIKNYTIKTQTLSVNAAKKQGYWGFETALSFNGLTYPYSTSGQAPEGSTTVVNPLFATSPVPTGSCVVTAAFEPGKLTITGTETSDIVINVSLSTNKSFEWIEVVADGQWEPGKGERVVDMGIRGMKPRIQ